MKLIKACAGSCILALLSSCTAMKNEIGDFNGKEKPTLYSPVTYRKDELFTNARTKAWNDNSKSSRNSMLLTGVMVINQNYRDYIDYSTRKRADFLSIADISALGASSASTIAAPPGSKTIFSAISTFILGGKTSAEKNYYNDISFFVLSSRMKADRADKYLKMVAKMNSKEIGSYSVDEALVDLDDYYSAGTVMESYSAQINASEKATNTAKDETANILEAKDKKAAGTEFLEKTEPPSE